MHHNFLGSEGLQATHIDALNPFTSKSMTLTPRVGLWTFSQNLTLCEPCQAELKAGRSGKPVTWGLKTRKKNYGKWNTYFYALEHEVPTLCYITWSVLIVFIMILFRIEIGMRSHSLFFPKLQAEVQKTWNLFCFLKFRYYEKATKISLKWSSVRLKVFCFHKPYKINDWNRI